MTPKYFDLETTAGTRHDRKKCGPISRPVTSRGSRNWCAEGFYRTVSCSTGVSKVFMDADRMSFGTGTGGFRQEAQAEFNIGTDVRAPPRWRVPPSPDSGDSQFFICFDYASFSTPVDTVWGRGHVRAWRMSTRSARRAGQNPDKIVTARMALDAA